MRASEFAFEGATTPSISNLVSTIETLRNKTDQIRIDSLVNLVRKRPGSEMFNIDILVDAFEKNPTVKNLITDIKDDDSGVKYAYLKSLTADDSEIIAPNLGGNDSAGGSRSPEDTVKSMAKRATNKRL